MLRPLVPYPVRIRMLSLMLPLLLIAALSAAQPQGLWYGVYLVSLNIGTRMFQQQTDAAGESFVASARVERSPNLLISELTLDLNRAGDVRRYRRSLDEREESSVHYTIERVGASHRFEVADKDASGAVRDSGELSLEARLGGGAATADAGGGGGLAAFRRGG